MHIVLRDFYYSLDGIRPIRAFKGQQLDLPPGMIPGLLDEGYIAACAPPHFDQPESRVEAVEPPASEGNELVVGRIVVNVEVAEPTVVATVGEVEAPVEAKDAGAAPENKQIEAAPENKGEPAPIRPPDLDGDGKPGGKLSRKEITADLDRLGIEYDPKASWADLNALLRKDKAKREATVNASVAG